MTAKVIVEIGFWYSISQILVECNSIQLRCFLKDTNTPAKRDGNDYPKTQCLCSLLPYGNTPGVKAHQQCWGQADGWTAHA